MSAQAATKPSSAAEGFPEYHTGNAEDLYIEGYDPSSLGASHSSLLKTTTWVGMGLFMAALGIIGLGLFGVGQVLYGTGSVDHDPMIFVYLGFGIGGVLMILSIILMAFVGRKDYKAYVKRTGRIN